MHETLKDAEIYVDLGRKKESFIREGRCEFSM